LTFLLGSTVQNTPEQQTSGQNKRKNRDEEHNLGQTSTQEGGSQIQSSPLKHIKKKTRVDTNSDDEYWGGSNTPPSGMLFDI
jgi:hypothetical protein